MLSLLADRVLWWFEDSGLEEVEHQVHEAVWVAALAADLNGDTGGLKQPLLRRAGVLPM